MITLLYPATKFTVVMFCNDCCKCVVHVLTLLCRVSFILLSLAPLSFETSFSLYWCIETFDVFEICVCARVCVRACVCGIDKAPRLVMKTVSKKILQRVSSTVLFIEALLHITLTSVSIFTVEILIYESACYRLEFLHSLPAWSVISWSTMVWKTLIEDILVFECKCLFLGFLVVFSAGMSDVLCTG